MGEIVNFRRAKKAKARAAKEETSAGNRAKFGTPKAIRDLDKARAAKETRDVDAHKRDDET